MSLMLEHKQGLIAGDGTLPVKMAQYAKENGFDVICISLSKDNLSQLKKYCSKVYSCHPGEINKIEKILKDEDCLVEYRNSCFFKFFYYQKHNFIIVKSFDFFY